MTLGSKLKIGFGPGGLRLVAIPYALLLFVMNANADTENVPSAAMDSLPVTSEADQQLPVRGVIRSRQKANISTELAARVEHVAFKEGEQFFEGDLLIRFDCRRLIAEWEAAEAYKREMNLALKSAVYLLKEQVGNQHRVDAAKIRVDRANADLKALATRVDQCEIRAPFDGIVSQVTIQQHEMAMSGRPLMSIISFNDPRLELIVPSNWLVWLKRGNIFEFRIDETQSNHRAEVTRVGAVVDSVSQTVKVFANFMTSPVDVLPGMSGTANFK